MSEANIFFLTEHFLTHLNHYNKNIMRQPIQQYISKVRGKVLGARFSKLILFANKN